MLPRRAGAGATSAGAQWKRVFPGAAIMQIVAASVEVKEHGLIAEPLTHGQVLVSLLVSLIVSFLG